MIIRIILVVFASVASGISYLAGLIRLMSALLVGFGALVSFFFGILFMVPEENRQLWFPVYGQGTSWPFFMLSAVLAVIIVFFFVKKRESVEKEDVSSTHIKYFVTAFFGYLLSIFLSAFFWFPSDIKRLSLEISALSHYMLIGTCIYLLGTTLSLYLFYRGSKGSTEKYPDFMRRIVLAIFSIVHFDKMPVLIAFLLIYSPETGVIYPSIAALALSAYIPIGFFLLKLSRQSEESQ